MNGVSITILISAWLILLLAALFHWYQISRIRKLAEERYQNKTIMLIMALFEAGEYEFALYMARTIPNDAQLKLVKSWIAMEYHKYLPGSRSDYEHLSIVEVLVLVFDNEKHDGARKRLGKMFCDAYLSARKHYPKY